MATIHRRVSFIVPSPDHTPPELELPPLGGRKRGQTQPQIVPKQGIPPPSINHTNANGQSYANHPRHSLGVTSLALDTSTLLADSASPGGILYTAGRDGLVASWELGVPHKRRRNGGRYELLPGRGTGRVKWEKIGDGAEMWDEDEDEEMMNAMNGEMGFENSTANGTDDAEEIWSSDEEIDGFAGIDGQRGDGRRVRPARGEVPYEDRWEVDYEAVASSRPSRTTFRQSAQTHTDWVNAMLLCNLNQTIVTASSDRTIRAWSPHSTTNTSPSLVGHHRDYVRSLAWAKYPGLLFSGALDRQVAIWDISQPNPDQPLLNIDLNKADDWAGVGMEGERGSVYALGIDPAGKVLAAGTPERVVRLWDPRSGDKSIGKLIGHSDCVRSVIVSEDGKYLLTGSSDTTIKLWSLAAHRCLHTFNHHTSSVWSLHSTHPNLERFYSGSRDGMLCVVDLEQANDISDGECVVLARENDGTPRKGEEESKSGDEGIRSIVAMDDEFVWTATGSAEVKKWKDVGRKINRLSNHDEDDDGVSYHRRPSHGEIVYPIPGTNGTAENSLGLDSPFNPAPAVEGLGLRNKRLSIDDGVNGGDLLPTESRDSRTIAFAPTPSPRGFQNDNSASPSGATLSPVKFIQPRRTSQSGVSIAASVASNSSAPADEQPLTSSATTASLNGIPYDSLVSLGLPDSPYSFGFSHAHRSGDVNDNKSIISNGVPAFKQTPAQRARERFQDREIAAEAVPLRTQPEEVIEGKPGLIRSVILNDRQHVLTVDTEGQVAVWNIIKGTCIGKFSSEDVSAALHLEQGLSGNARTEVRKHSVEVLEMVRERIEGETMVITWCNVDTRIGSLVVHMEEGRVFDAEVYADELGISGRDGLRDDTRLNLGKWTLANLFKGLIKAEERDITAHYADSPLSTTASLPRSPEIRSVPLDRGQAAPSHRKRAMSGVFNTQPPTLAIPGLATPASRPAVAPDDTSLSKSAPSNGPSAWQSFQALRTGPGTLSSVPQTPGSVVSGGAPTTPGETLGTSYGTSRGDYFSTRRKDPSPSRADETKTPTTPSAADKAKEKEAKEKESSMMGKFKGFGKKKKAETMSTVVESKETAVEEQDNGPKMSERDAEQLRILDMVRSHPFHPPSTLDAPPIPYPGNTSLLISEESKDAGAWVVTYRSQVGSTESDMEPLEMNSPMWLLDYLFTGRTKVKDPVKLTFILEPMPGCGLKEMPEGTTRLSASRILRARKIMAFIYEKLELGQRARTGSLAQSKLGALAARKFSSGHDQSNNPFGGQSGRGGAATIDDQRRGSIVDDFSPEDALELVCGDHVVDPRMTLATLKQYYGAGGDMQLYYRPKQGSGLA